MLHSRIYAYSISYISFYFFIMSMSVVQRFFFLALLFLDGIVTFCLVICIFSTLVSIFLVACFSTFFIAYSFLGAFFLNIFCIFCAATSTFLAAAYIFLILAVTAFLAAVAAFFSTKAANLAFF